MGRVPGSSRHPASSRRPSRQDARLNLPGQRCNTSNGLCTDICPTGQYRLTCIEAEIPRFSNPEEAVRDPVIGGRKSSCTAVAMDGGPQHEGGILLPVLALRRQFRASRRSSPARRWQLRQALIAQRRRRATFARSASRSRKRADERFWAGARLGLFLPYGALYSNQALVTTPFQDVATAGPELEFDLGGRFARHFVAYALIEHAFLGRGRSSAWTEPHGGQSAASTQAVGIGLRWESNPAGLGVVADVAVAYRWFNVRWNDGTTLRMHGPGDVRFGLGAAWRVARNVTIAPMMMASSGTFAYRTLDGQKLGDSTGSYASLALTLNAPRRSRLIPSEVQPVAYRAAPSR